MLNILFFGDIVGRLGRRGVVDILPRLKNKYTPDLIIANAENIAHGKGVTEATLEELHEAGIDYFTSGNHIWAKPESLAILEKENSILLRPDNYPPGAPGRGALLLTVKEQKILLINLQGRVFMGDVLDCPFRAIDAILKQYNNIDRIATVVDFHAEATSEKVSFGLYLDGRVSAVFGTHTHVPTADEQILPGGTAYITDIGMVGGKGTVIGVEKENIIKRFLTQRPVAHEMPEKGVCIVNGIFISVGADSKAVKVERFREEVEVF